jgi:hypothetical protein
MYRRCRVAGNKVVCDRGVIGNKTRINVTLRCYRRGQLTGSSLNSFDNENTLNNSRVDIVGLKC